MAIKEELQRIRANLVPEFGLNLDPSTVRQLEVSNEFSRVLAHLCGFTGSIGILLKATSAGELRVSSTVYGGESYTVSAGVGVAAYVVGSTYTYAMAQVNTEIRVTANDAVISFRNVAGVWLPDMSIPVGFYSNSFVHFGIRVRNLVPANICVYEIRCFY